MAPDASRVSPERGAIARRHVPVTVVTIAFLTVAVLVIAGSRSWLQRMLVDIDAPVPAIAALALSPWFALFAAILLLATVVQAFVVRSRRASFVCNGIAGGAGVILLGIYAIGAIIPFLSAVLQLR